MEDPTRPFWKIINLCERLAEKRNCSDRASSHEEILSRLSQLEPCQALKALEVLSDSLQQNAAHALAKTPEPINQWPVQIALSYANDLVEKLNIRFSVLQRSELKWHKREEIHIREEIQYYALLLKTSHLFKQSTQARRMNASPSRGDDL